MVYEEESDKKDSKNEVEEVEKILVARKNGEKIIDIRNHEKLEKKITDMRNHEKLEKKINRYEKSRNYRENILALSAFIQSFVQIKRTEKSHLWYVLDSDLFYIKTQYIACIRFSFFVKLSYNL